MLKVMILVCLSLLTGANKNLVITKNGLLQRFIIWF